MIEKICIKNFKSLKDIVIETKHLNLLAGLNGMGKSSFIQILLLLKQSDGITTNGELKLKGRLIDIGKGNDALYQFASEECIQLSLFLNNENSFNWSFIYRPESELLKSDQKYQPNMMEELLTGFQYLCAERIGPMAMYEASQQFVDAQDLGVRGEYAVHFLHLNGNRFKIDTRLKHCQTDELDLMNQVNGWLSEISPGIKLNVIELPGVDKMLLNYQFHLGLGRTNSFKPVNVGFGISYVLSIVVCLLVSKNNRLLIIENPEAHIHPRGQVELGKLMALSSSCGTQLFVETHSDHIINGIRVAVKESLIHKNDVNISYFTKKTTNDEQYTEVTEIKVDESGSLSEYPKDFLDEWNNQLLKLV
jgi:predicted ATPase